MKRTILVILAAVAMFSVCYVHAASAAPGELDEKLRKDAQEIPASGLIFMEVQVNDQGPLHRKGCAGFAVRAVSDAGNSKTFVTQDAVSFFGNVSENADYGGAAVLPAGSYTIAHVDCIGSVRWNGEFARFNLRAGEVVNLGLLVIDYERPLLSLSFTARTRVVDLSPKAVASLTKRAPVAFSKATKRYMKPNPATSTR